MSVSDDSARIACATARSPTGYSHPRYAASLAGFGNPRLLPRSGAWILEREIPGFSYLDGMGCYPLFACHDWRQLHADLEDLGSSLVSLAVVAEPFGAYDVAYLQRCFKDVVTPLKQHFVVDLGRSMGSFVSEHHRRYAKKALREVSVERCHDPARFLGEWVDLYQTLIRRHDIRGVAAFSRKSFAEQLQVPGIVMFRGEKQAVTLGMTLWYIQGDAGYYHLGACSEQGYEERVSFALFWRAIEHFAASGLRRLNLGAGAGLRSTDTDGLSRFKRGWATETRPAYLCGRIFDRTAYEKLTRIFGALGADYFPAYRTSEVLAAPLPGGR